MLISFVVNLLVSLCRLVSSLPFTQIYSLQKDSLWILIFTQIFQQMVLFSLPSLPSHPHNFYYLLREKASNRFPLPKNTTYYILEVPPLHKNSPYCFPPLQTKISKQETVQSKSKTWRKTKTKRENKEVWETEMQKKKTSAQCGS